MKRITYWPQAVLGEYLSALFPKKKKKRKGSNTKEKLISDKKKQGLAFNWGALLGWSAVANSVNWSVALPLYAGGIAWTLVYDSIYAHQDKNDDKTVGIRSTALLFGDHSRAILSTLSVSSLSLITYAGYLNGHGSLFYAGVGLAAAQLARILVRTDFDSRPSCWSGFVGCGWAGFWVWMGALADFLSLGTGFW